MKYTPASQRGQSLVEMGLTMGLVAIVAIGVLTMLGDSLGDMIGGSEDNPQGGFFGAVDK